MKKRIMMALAVCALAVLVTACGSKTDKNSETTAKESTETAEEKAEETGKSEEKEETGDTEKETESKETEEKETEETLDAEIEAEGPGATVSDTASEEDKNFADLENSDYTGFANQIVETVKSKNMEALADLMAYPSYVSCVRDNDGIVNSREEFLAQDPEMIFDQTLIDAVTAADLSELEPLMAGIVVGDSTPNIVFNSRDGKLGITGINY